MARIMKRDELKKNAWDTTNSENPSCQGRNNNYSDEICNAPKSNI